MVAERPWKGALLHGESRGFPVCVTGAGPTDAEGVLHVVPLAVEVNVAGRALCGAYYKDNPVTGISQQLLPSFGISGRKPLTALVEGLVQPLEEPGEVVFGEELAKNKLSGADDAAYLLVNGRQLHEQVRCTC
jgi:hypothetical protein